MSFFIQTQNYMSKETSSVNICRVIKNLLSPLKKVRLVLEVYLSLNNLWLILLSDFFVSLKYQPNRKAMFKKTALIPQLDMFTAYSMQLGSRASKKYSDPNAWHNQFYSLVTTKIDEDTFKPLFPEDKKNGRPNASIRILVGMSVLKEGFGCSDEDLFEKCEFDLLTRKALGLELLTDVTPSIDTYYLFRRRICKYQEETGIDLMQQCFELVAGNQVRLLRISGKSVRMDSSLSVAISLASPTTNWFIRPWSSFSRHTRFPISPKSRKNKQGHIWTRIPQRSFTVLMSTRFRAIFQG